MKLYKCQVCGNVIEKIYDKGVPVMCCGQPMQELKANTVDAAVEKHVPVAVVDGDILNVKVGEVAHPMMKEHYITSIFVVYNNKVQRADLTFEDAPEASFVLGGYKGTIEVYEYCNLHGLWKTVIEA